MVGYLFHMSLVERALFVAGCAVVFIALVVFLVRSRRRGGLGPPITVPAWTKAGRARTNRSYEKHGWAKPYDDEGNLLPASQRTKPTES